MPRIVGLSMVKNEQDIIEPFVRHNTKFVDFLVILENRSTDRTRNILNSLMAEIDGVIVTTLSNVGYAQSEIMTNLLQSCQETLYADYVVFLDADEFISCNGRIEFERQISKIPSGGYGEVAWRSHVLVPTDFHPADPDPPRSMPWRRLREGHQWYKAVLRLDGFYSADLVVSQGNHSITSSAGRFMPSERIDDVFLHHYPLRSLDQFKAKCVVGWMAYLAKDPLANRKGAGSHWYENLETISEEGPALSYETLCELSIRYAQPLTEIDWKNDVVQESPPFTYERRYSPGSYADATSIIIRSWQASLEKRQPLLELNRASALSTEASAGGTAFDANWHWDHTFADLPPFIYIGEKHQIRSVLDLGCGIGAYLRLFTNLGIQDILGVDGLPRSATVLSEVEYRQADLMQPLTFGKQFDLVMCLEVVEHLPAAAATALLDTIARHASGTILFSAAEPGQPGEGHINCHPLEFWLSEWSMRGWAPDLSETLSVRALSTLPWFKRNLVVLKAGSSPHSGQAESELKKISRLPINWPSTRPGIRDEVLTDRLNPDALSAPPPSRSHRDLLKRSVMIGKILAEKAVRLLGKLEQRL
jgi:SAM-dependent methyltransferase